jgi:hypothetical protein
MHKTLVRFSVFISFWLGLSPLALAENFHPDQRVYIGIYADNIEEDLFAEGKVVKDLGRDVVVDILRVSGFRQHAFKGCKLPWIPDPQDTHAIPTDELYRLVTEQKQVTLPKSQVVRWERGEQIYWDRDWLKDIYLRWMGDHVGLSQERLTTVAPPVAEKMRLPGVSDFLPMAAAHHRATRIHFGMLAEREDWAKGMMPVLDAIEQLLKKYPELGETITEGKVYFDSEMGLRGGFFLSRAVRKAWEDVAYAVRYTEDADLANRLKARQADLLKRYGLSALK